MREPPSLNFCITIKIYKFAPRFCGRVARQSSAKARTAVRIRSEPLKLPKILGAFFMNNRLISRLFYKTCLRRHLIIASLTLIAVLQLQSQDFLSWRYSDRYFSLHVGSGHSMYLGELNKALKVQKELSNLTLGLEARLLSKVAARIDIGYYRLESGDYLSPIGSFEHQRNLSFFSNNFEASLLGVFYMQEYGGDYFRRWRVDPFLTLGVGFTTYNPKTEFNGITYELRPFRTEEVDYGNKVFMLPASAGLKLKINPFINFNLEIAYRYTFSDYLDDVSSNYPLVIEDDLRSLLINRKNEIRISNPEAYTQLTAGNPRGNPKNNDQYLFLGYRLEIYLPNNKGPVFKKPSAY